MEISAKIFGDVQCERTNDDITQYINILVDKTVKALKEDDFEALMNLKCSYTLLSKIFDGIPLRYNNIIPLLTVQCSLVQLQVVLILKKSLSSMIEVSNPMKRFHSNLSKICRFFQITADDILDSFTKLLFYLKHHKPEIFLILLKYSLVTVFFESFCDSSFNPTYILKIMTKCVNSFNKDSTYEVSFFMAVEIKDFLECSNNSLEKTYIYAWKYFQKGQYKEALKCLEDVDTTCGSSTQVSYIKLLQGNCHLLLDHPNRALLQYHHCIVSANQHIMASALSNCCFLSRIYKYSFEIDLRQIHLRCLKVHSNCDNMLLSLNTGASFSRLQLANIDLVKVAIYSGLRAFKLNRPDVVVFWISQVLKNTDHQQQPSMCYLILIKAGLLCGDYKCCWEALCEFKNFMKIASKSHNEKFLVVIFQVCYLGCHIALHLHRIHLAEMFGQWCVNVGNFIKATTTNYKLKSWICHVQALCLALLCVVYIGKKKMKGAKKFMCYAEGILPASSLFVLYTHCLVMCKEGHLKECADHWLKQFKNISPEHKDVSVYDEMNKAVQLFQQKNSCC